MRKTARFAVVTDGLSKAYRGRDRRWTLGNLAEKSGFPHGAQISAIFTAPFRATEKTLARLEKVAKILEFRGTLHKPIAPAKNAPKTAARKAPKSKAAPKAAQPGPAAVPAE